MSTVIAVREEHEHGPYIGFQVDSEFLECSRCKQATEYRLRYTEDQQKNLTEHRLTARQVIEAEHPNHQDDFRVG
ncbi:MAG: hypothetical protein WBF25_03215 [Terriglobales bacterium]